jgi:hypothetical protein
VLGVEVGEHGVEVVQVGWPHAAQAQVAAQHPRDLVELVAQPVDLRKHALSVVQDQRALGCQVDAAA